MTDWLGLGPGPAPAPAARRGPGRGVPSLDAHVLLPAGRYRIGEPGEERRVALGPVSIGRFPVANAHLRRFFEATGREAPPLLAAKLTDPQLADHPATDVSLADAEDFCAWLGDDVRLPTGDEWEALARGADGRAFPWGDVFEADRCASADGWGWTAPVTAHPDGAGPFGAEQLAGNVWEWVAGRRADGWATVRGGSYRDTEWGLRCSRTLAADPERPTPTTGFRIAIDRRREA